MNQVGRWLAIQEQTDRQDEDAGQESVGRRTAAEWRPRFPRHPSGLGSRRKVVITTTAVVTDFTGRSFTTRRLDGLIEEGFNGRLTAIDTTPSCFGRHCGRVSGTCLGLNVMLLAALDRRVIVAGGILVVTKADRGCSSIGAGRRCSSKGIVAKTLLLAFFLDNILSPVCSDRKVRGDFGVWKRFGSLFGSGSRHDIERK
mmetsp:Transcript_4194/g.8542  ORF Transcript_4194/g.8542 Transcript_4194/m.8542 type:complete len:200 (-) Transcript_4194:831-1430(-)